MKPLLLCTSLLLSFSSAPAATIALQPASQSVLPGDTIVLDVVISNLASSVVGDFDLDIGFDPALLTFDGYALSGALGDVSSAAALDFSLGLTGPGSVNLAVVSLLPETTLQGIQSPPFSLATLQFTVGPLPPGGITIVSISTVNALGDGAGDPIPVDSLGLATLTSDEAGIPEPGTLLLAVTGLTGLVAVRLRRSPG